MSLARRKSENRHFGVFAVKRHLSMAVRRPGIELIFKTSLVPEMFR
jgi:hypothetical protein